MLNAYLGRERPSAVNRSRKIPESKIICSFIVLLIDSNNYDLMFKTEERIND
jgi:hypothetical protein